MAIAAVVEEVATEGGGGRWRREERSEAERSEASCRSGGTRVPDAGSRIVVT